MLGTIRLLLALAVAASHAKVLVAGLNPGVIAVVCFYLISGYVMAGLMQRHYSHASQAPAFYLDRAIRLLPQYLFYCGMTLAWHFFSSVATPFLIRSPGAVDLLNNLFIVPLNYYMFNASDQYTLVPPAWSLGAEIQFYLIAPVLLLQPKRLWGVGLLSICVYVAALFGLLNSEWFGYRLIPGVLFMFALGAGLQHFHQQVSSVAARHLTIAVVLAAAIALGLLQLNGLLHQPYSFETLLGLIIGMTLLHTLAQRRPATSAKSANLAKCTKWDTLAGDISYGVFLNHFFIIWTLYPNGVDASQIPIFLTICFALSLVSQRLVEQPLLKLRHRFRKSRNKLPQGDIVKISG